MGDARLRARSGWSRRFALAGCGSSGGGVTAPKIAPRDLQPGGLPAGGTGRRGRPTTLSFTIKQPSGKPLTSYRTCCDPHAGVDLIIVRSDDSHVQYDDSRHRPRTAGHPAGHVPRPGALPDRHRHLPEADAAELADQLPAVHLGHRHRAPTTRAAARRSSADPVVDGYRFQIQGHPALKAIQAQFLNIKVPDPAGHKAVFGTWRGALAHAIFIHEGSLDYFHTHVCAPGAALLHLRAGRRAGHRQLDRARAS